MLSDQLFATEHTDPPAELAALAAEISDRSRTPAEAARTICDMVGDRLECVPGATNVTDTASVVWEKQKGVCQDIAHVTLGALRAIWIPARYMSGYLQPSKDPEIGEELSAQSHAWVGVVVRDLDRLRPDQRAGDRGRPRDRRVRPRLSRRGAAAWTLCRQRPRHAVRQCRSHPRGVDR